MVEKKKEAKAVVQTVHPFALKDPKGDRKCPDVPRPPAIPLSIEQAFKKEKTGDTPDMGEIRSHLNLEGTIDK